MKKYSIFALVLVLTVTLFTGCGCRNTQPANTSMPTASTTPVTTTAPTTPSTATTQSTFPDDATIEDGNGPLPTNATAGGDGITDDTEATTDARSRNGGAAKGSTGTNGNNNNGTTGEGRARRVPQN